MDLFSTKIAYADLDGVLGHINTLIVNPLIELLFALAVVYFLFGVYEFISSQESEEGKTKGKEHMLWGVIGITIMMAVWTILSIILNTLQIPKNEIDPENNKVSLPPYKP